MSNISEKKKHIRLILLIYTLTWWLLLINSNGVYWDGWTLVEQDLSSILNTFKAAGTIFNGYIHIFVLSFDCNVLIYRIITFLCYLLSGIITYEMLPRISKLSPESSLFIVLIMLTFPVNQARISIVNSPAALSVGLFFLASYLILGMKNREKFLIKTIALVLFFISFDYNSLLVFYIIPIASLYYLDRDKWVSKLNTDALRKFLTYSSSYFFFLVLPIVYFFIKRTFFETYGEFQNYNEMHITVSSLLRMPEMMLKSFFTEVFSLGYYINITSILIVALVYLMLIRVSIPDTKPSFIMIGIGGVILFAAVFPYYAVGKFGSTEWQNRYLILTPLGASIILYGICLAFFKGRVLKTALAILIGLSIYKNNLIMNDFLREKIKQDAIIESFKKSDEIRNATAGVIFFIDKTEKNNAMNRKYRFYEWNGMMKKAFSGSSRLGVNLSERKMIYNWLEYRMIPEYNFFNFSGGPEVSGIVVIDSADKTYTLLSSLKLLFLSHIAVEHYREEISKYYTVVWLRSENYKSR